jgi:protein TonB
LLVHGVALAAIVWGAAPVSSLDGRPVMDVELVVTALAPGGDAPAAAVIAVTAAPSGHDAPTARSDAPPPAPDVATGRAPDAPAAVSRDHSSTDLAVVLPPSSLPAVHAEDWRSSPPPASAPTAPAVGSPPSVPAVSPPSAPSTPAPGPAASPPSGPSSPMSTASPRPTVPSPARPPSQAPATAAPPPPAAPSPSLSARTPPPTAAADRLTPPVASTRTPRDAAGAPGESHGAAAASTDAGARSAAQLVRHIAPVYPALARERGQEGRVVVRLVVGADGVPADIRLAESSGVAALDAAALDAVRQWRFAPARRAGAAVAEERLAPVVFRLRH